MIQALQGIGPIRARHSTSRPGASRWHKMDSKRKEKSLAVLDERLQEVTIYTRLS